MIEDAMKTYLKGANRALHAWRIKKDCSLVPILITPEQPVLFDSKHCYLISKYFKGESFDCAHTVCKLKLWVWIGCQCAYYRTLFSPILQCCRGLTLSQLTVELFAEFQFNESPDFLFWLNTNLATGSSNMQYHPLIRYSFIGRKEVLNYYMILTTVENSKMGRHFTSITHVPALTKEIFPECSYISINKKETNVTAKILIGQKVPEVHVKISLWLMEQFKKKGDTVRFTQTKIADSEWQKEFDKGNYDYLAENFWSEEEENYGQHKDFADKVLKNEANLSINKEEFKNNEKDNGVEYYRIYFENYKTSVKGMLEEEMKNNKMGLHTVNRFVSGWKLHYKPIPPIKKGKFLDSKEVIVFNVQKYILLWMGSMVPLWITGRALSIAKDYLHNFLKIETLFKPYYLSEDLSGKQFRHFIFLFQGKESHRFKSLFSKWPIQPINYYVFPKKRQVRIGFRTEKQILKKYSVLSDIRSSIDPENLNYWKCITRNITAKPPKEIKKNIMAFPYNLIYGFKLKDQKARMPIFMSHTEVYKVLDNKIFSLCQGKSRFIFDSYSTYLIIVMTMYTPNSLPVFFLYLWRGGIFGY